MNQSLRAKPGFWVAVGLVTWALTVSGVHVMARAGGAEEAGQRPVAVPMARTQAPGAAAPAAAPAAPQGPATNIGDKACLECHDQFEQGYAGTPHYRAMDPRTPAAKFGCESCHGPASLHAEDPAVHLLPDLSTSSPETVNATCATCHTRGEHALWEGSQHESRGLSCATCHNIHTPKSPEHALTAANETTLCATCHRDKAARIDRSGHMPVREGKMECSTCHSPHGSTNVKLLTAGDSVAEMCTSCHADKRGPYLFEHAPGRDGCATCHDPHGSSNERMLVAKPPILCQRCHIATRHPSTIYDAALVGAGSTPSARVYARSCVTCHSNIHGSNHPSGQFFVR